MDLTEDENLTEVPLLFGADSDDESDPNDMVCQSSFFGDWAGAGMAQGQGPIIQVRLLSSGSVVEGTQLTESDDEDPNNVVFNRVEATSKEPERTRQKSMTKDAATVKRRDQNAYSAPPALKLRDLRPGLDITRANGDKRPYKSPLNEARVTVTNATSVKTESESSDFILSRKAPRPGKRPRDVFDGIVLPTLEQVNKRRKMNVNPDLAKTEPEEDHKPRAEEADEKIEVESAEIVEVGEHDGRMEVENSEETTEEQEDYKKMKLWKNPKVKKNEDLGLLPETIRYRIKPIGFEIQDQYFTIGQVAREVMITGQFMSSEYGGSPQETQPRIAEKFVAKHGMRDFFYVNTDYQPQAPEVPGAPGLWLCTEAGSDIGQFRIITKIKDTSAKSDDKWQYVGQYQISAAVPPSLTVQEWKAQSAKFHTKWANAIATQGWGANVRIRIYARKKLKREPTKNDYLDIFSSGKYQEVTADEVKVAYLSGKERMGVWTMKCVGYDNNFQRELSEKFPTWVPPPPTKEKKKAAKKLAAATLMAESGTVKKTKSSHKRTRTPKKSEPEIKNFEEEDVKVEILDISDDDENADSGYQNAGSRSAPICL